MFVALSLLVAIAIGARPARSGPRPPCTRPRIVVHKQRAELELVCDEGSRRYPVTFGAAPVGAKRRRGDERTPEGRYRITAKSAPTRFHRFLKVSYPNDDDRRRAQAAGVDPGGGIGVHGVRSSLAGIARLFIRAGRAVSGQAWGPTDGCVGMINEDVEELYDLVPVGTEIVLQP